MDALAQRPDEQFVIKAVKTLGDVALNEPRCSMPVVVDFPERSVTSALRTEAVGVWAELRFVIRSEDHAHHFLQQLIRPGGHAQWPFLGRVLFLDVHSS